MRNEGLYARVIPHQLHRTDPGLIEFILPFKSLAAIFRKSQLYAGSLLHNCVVMAP